MIVLCCRTLSNATFPRYSRIYGGPATTSRNSGLMRIWSFVSRRLGQSLRKESNWNCVTPSSLGACSRKRAFPAERFAVWTLRLNGYRSSCRGYWRNRATLLLVMDAACRFSLPSRQEQRWLACGIVRDACQQPCTQRFPCMRPLSSNLSTAGWDVLFANALTMLNHPTVANTLPAPSTPRKPKGGAWSAFNLPLQRST